MRLGLTPKDAITYLSALSKQSQRIAGDAATKYQIRLMFNYITEVLQYQEVMQPATDSEGGFTCPRCGERMIAESGTVDDYKFCPLCGQRWKEVEE